MTSTARASFFFSICCLALLALLAMAIGIHVKDLELIRDRQFILIGMACLAFLAFIGWLDAWADYNNGR